MRNRKVLNITLAVITVLVLGIVVAYAALSAALNITFNGVTQNKLTWNVAFQGNSVNASSSGTSSTGRTCGVATVTATSVTVATTTLSKPEDKCIYTLTVKNGGDIGAKLTSITPTRPTGTNVSCSSANGPTMLCGNITYKLTSDSGGATALATNTTLAAGASSTIYLVASYTGTSLSTSQITQSGARFTLNYAQA